METETKGPRNRSLRAEWQWDERTRERIKAGVLIDLLHKCASGKITLTQARLKAIELLLRKVLPDLAAITVQADVTHRYVAELPNVLSRAEWQRIYGHDHLQPPDESNGSTH